MIEKKVAKLIDELDNKIDGGLSPSEIYEAIKESFIELAQSYDKSFSIETLLDELGEAK